MPTEDEKPATDPPPSPEDSALGGEAERDRSVRQRLEAFIPDMVKKTFYAGLGAVFTTEEGIRRIAQEFSLPKDVASYLVSSAKDTKDELFRIVARELREFLQDLNLSQELAKLLTQLSFEIKTEIRFIPNDEALVKPNVRSKVTLKRDPGSNEEPGA